MFDYPDYDESDLDDEDIDDEEYEYGIDADEDEELAV